MIVNPKNSTTLVVGVRQVTMRSNNKNKEMREMSRYEEEETFEVDPHVFDKERREKRIKGKKRDKSKDQWTDGKSHNPKRQKDDRRQEKESLRNLMKNYA